MKKKVNRDKRASMAEAIQQVPAEGCTIAFGGVTMYRRPMAFALGLLSRHQQESKPIDLTLLCFTAGLESDILVGEGMVSKVRSCYFGLETFGFAPHFTAAATAGDLEISEETEASLALGLRATMGEVGFMPSTAWRGTDLPNLRPDVKTIVDPYTGEELTAFPAISCDVAVLHALEADHHGNARIGGNQGVDRELALVADVVIVTSEKVVPKLYKADIIAPVVDMVVEAPLGAWPTSCHPLYPLDSEATLEYAETAGGENYPSLIDAWLKKHNLPSSN